MLLVQRVRTHGLVLLIVAIVAAAALWLSLGTYTRWETARGILVTREASAKVVALRPGQIVRLLVAEGDAVRAGQTLALVRIEQTGELGESAFAQSLGALEWQRRSAAARRAPRVEEPVYRLEVVPDAQSVAAFGELLPLQPGMTLSANLILDRRPFLDWLLTPINAVLQRNGA